MRSWGVCLLVLVGFHLKSQVKLDSISRICENAGYITLGPGIGNIEPLLFEALIGNSFSSTFGKKNRVGIVFTPNVNVRMKYEHSFPIINPSYRAIGDINYKLSKTNNELRFLSFSIGHHSNGQADYFYDWTIQQIDFKDGNFMTNFLKLGITNLFQKNISSLNSFIKNTIELEWHPNLARNPFLDEMYNDLRVNIRSKLLFPKISRFLRDVKLSSNFIILTETNNGQLVNKRNAISMDLMLSFKPYKKSDFSLFTQYYNGEDYYNLYFNRRLKVIRIGLLATPRNKSIFK